MHPIQFKDLKKANNCFAPQIKQMSRRLKKKRICKEKIKEKKPRACSLCDTISHNRRQYNQEQQSVKDIKDLDLDLDLDSNLDLDSSQYSWKSLDDIDDEVWEEFSVTDKTMEVDKEN